MGGCRPDFAGWSGWPSTAALSINPGIDVMCHFLPSADAVGPPLPSYQVRFNVKRRSEPKVQADRARAPRMTSASYQLVLKRVHRTVGVGNYAPPLAGAASLVLRASRSERPFASSLSRRTISAVLRMSASRSSSPIVEAIARSRALNSR